MAQATSVNTAPTSEVSKAAPFVIPFAVFVVILVINPYFPVPQWVRFVIEVALFVTISRAPLSTAPAKPWVSILLGVIVFAIWVAPDQLIAGYRSLPLFSNSIVGHAVGTTAASQKHDLSYIIPRVLVSVLAVPVLEELFWRGFLLRVTSFWIVALLFASEHGSYWDVGLVTGVIYNWWMLRTSNLWSCIIAHAVTNGCLATFVIAGNHWQYWL
jgi:CAAX prenyl protease-like protein